MKSAERIWREARRRRQPRSAAAFAPGRGGSGMGVRRRPRAAQRPPGAGGSGAGMRRRPHPGGEDPTRACGGDRTYLGVDGGVRTRAGRIRRGRVAAAALGGGGSHGRWAAADGRRRRRCRCARRAPMSSASLAPFLFFYSINRGGRLKMTHLQRRLLRGGCPCPPLKIYFNRL